MDLVRTGYSGIAGAAKAGVAGAAVRGAGAAGGDAVAKAVGLVAEVGAATDDSVGALCRARRIVRRRLNVVFGAKPVAAPLPHVADDVMEAEAVGIKSVRGSGTVVAILAGIDAWKPALPDVAAVKPSGVSSPPHG